MYIDTFEINGKYGFKDEWRIILPAQYDAAESFRGDYAIVVLNNKFGIINKEGTFVVENKYDDLHHLFDQYYYARINDGDTWSCGVIDTTGAIIIDFSFKCIYSKDNKYFNCYNEAECKYEGLKYLSLHGRYSYSNPSNCHWFSIEGKEITSLEVTSIHDNYLIVKNESNKYGLVSCDSSVLINPFYDTLEYCIENIFIALNTENEKKTYSIIKSDGTIILSSVFVIKSENGFFYIEKNDCKEWYSFEGNLVYTGLATPLSKEYLRIYKNNKYGVIDYKGNRVINFIYDEIKFANSYFSVRREKKIGLLGLKGEVIIDVAYDKVESVIIDNDPISLGNEVDPKYSWGDFHYQGYCREYCFDTLGHLNYSGKPYDKLKRNILKLNDKSRFNDGYSISDSVLDITKPLIISSDCKQELFTLSEGIIANSKFDSIQQITQLCYVVKSNEKFGIFRIDTQALIIPMIYDRIKFYGGHTVILCKDELWGAKSLILDKNPFHILFKVDIPIDNLEIEILDSLQLSFGVKRLYKHYNGEETEYFTILDSTGKEVENIRELFLNSQFTVYDKHHILSTKNGKYGFISELGYITLPFIYDELSVRKTGGYNVRIGNAWGVLDKDCHEIIRVKYDKPLPIYVVAPDNSYFGYDETKDDVAHITKRYKDLIIVTDGVSGRMGCLDIDGHEVIPTVFEHLMFNIPDKYENPSGFERDILFFGYGGYRNENGDGQSFFSDIDCANWGCINTNGQIIIEPKYDCFKVFGNFLLGGRDGSFLGEEGNDRSYYDKYSGVYDLYTREGELIIGGFREISYDEETKAFALFFGGEWKRYSTYDDDWNGIHCYDFQFNHNNDLWLIVNSELKSVIRKSDGSQYQFSKGFIGNIKIKKENNKVTHLYNMPIDLMAKGFSHFELGCAIIREGNSSNSKVAAIDLSSGLTTPFYENIKPIGAGMFFISKEHKVGISSFSGNILPTEYLLFTLPENGYFFAIKEIDENKSTVELFKIDDLSHPIIAIKNADTHKLINDVGYSRLKISINKGHNLSNLQVSAHDLYDDEFIKLIDAEESEGLPIRGFLPEQWQEYYYFSTDYRIGKEDTSDYCPDYDNHDYMRDSWDAMTDGMYGDMPDGFDGDFDFLGR